MNICVFCGSSVGKNSIYKDASEELGRAIANADHTLIYGGSKIGTMRFIADAAMSCGGKVIGIMPKMIVEKEIAYEEITELMVCETMFERKVIMTKISDAFVVMPGGLGTLDEMFEVLTLMQLKIIDKPLVILNTNGFFDKLIDFISNAENEGFIAQVHKESIIVVNEIGEVLEQIREFSFQHPKGWIDKLIKETDSSCNS